MYLSGFYLHLNAVVEIRKTDVLFTSSFTPNLKTFECIFVVSNHSINLWIEVKSLLESLRTEVSLSEKNFSAFTLSEKKFSAFTSKQVFGWLVGFAGFFFFF